MDDLELYSSIIEQLTPNLVANNFANNLRSKLVLLQRIWNKIVNCVSASLVPLG